MHFADSSTDDRPTRVAAPHDGREHPSTNTIDGQDFVLQGATDTRSGHGSDTFGSVRLWLCAAAPSVIAAVGCNSDSGVSGGPESGFATDETGGGDESSTSGEPEDACGAVDPDMVSCPDLLVAAAEAEQAAVGCNGAALDAGEAPLVPDAFSDWLLHWPRAMVETDPELVGSWTAPIPLELPTEGAPTLHLPIHSIHRPTGKFLQFGGHDTGDGNWTEPGNKQDKVVWYPPAPCFDPRIETCDVVFDALPATPEVEAHHHVDSTEDPDLTQVGLFCSGHVNLPPVDVFEYDLPRTLTVGGSSPEDVNLAWPGAYVFRESLPDDEPPAAEDWDWNQVEDLAASRWYPTPTVLPDERVMVSGGVFSNTDSRVCRDEADQEPRYDDDCKCVEEVGDFFFDRGLCSDGYCTPLNPNNPNDFLRILEFVNTLGFSPCQPVTNQIRSVEIGTRTGADYVAWDELGQAFAVGSYPQMFVLPQLPSFASTNLDGKVVQVGGEVSFAPGSAAFVLDPLMVVEPEDGLVPPAEIAGPSCTRGSSAVMYAEDKIMKFGGRIIGEVAGKTPKSASRMTEILDLSGPCPVWRRELGSELAQPRRFATGVLMPDGNVFVAGGTLSNGNLGDAESDVAHAAFATELFDRVEESWCRLADLPAVDSETPPVFRGYHSISFLLPDGRIYLGAGAGTLVGDPQPPHYDYQIFSPPYLFKGPRPSLTPGSGSVTINDITQMVAGGASIIFDIDEEVPISRVTLVKLSSVTHAFDQEQRLVELSFEPTFESEENAITVTPPESTCDATPGYYMLFAISNEGVPSIGQYVAIEGECAAAADALVVPEYPSPAAVALNDLAAAGTEGLRASCGEPGSTLGLTDLRRDLLELCTAASACPSNGTIDVEVRYGGGSGASSVSVDDEIASAAVTFVDGAPTFAGPDLALDVAGSDFSSLADLGPGDHILDICASFAALSACIEQPLRIDPLLADDESSGYRAAAIEPRVLALDKLVPGHALALGDDDVVAVPLPDGFLFPYFGDDVDAIWVGANGGIRVTAGDIPATNTGLPASLAPHIAAYWDDLDPTAGGRVTTYAAVDRFVIAWEDVAVASGGSVNVQLHLFRDGRIEMHYPSVSSGPDDHGASATIGVQLDGDALEVSDASDVLLNAHAALAIDATSCIASALRLPDSTPCADRPVVADDEVAICGTHADVQLSRPAVPTTCGAHAATTVRGTLWIDDERVTSDEGMYRVHPGDYVAQWTMLQPAGGAGLLPTEPVGDVGRQSIAVTMTDDESICCRADQTMWWLTSGNDGPTNVCGIGSCCAVALAGNDNLSAGAGSDTLLGREGVDTLYGGGGNDVVSGGIGNDWLSGGTHDDVLLGGDGNDSMVGDAGSDTLHGGAGNDALYGKDGNDEVWGGAGDDLIDEASYTGDELILPGAGIDAAYAGSGDDEVVVLDLCEVGSGEVLDGGSGSDVLWLPAGVEVSDLTTLGATVTGFETVSEIVGVPWGGSECAP